MIIHRWTIKQMIASIFKVHTVTFDISKLEKVHEKSYIKSDNHPRLSMVFELKSMSMFDSFALFNICYAYLTYLT